MFDKKITIRKALYERLEAKAEAMGYSSTEEMILDVLEKMAGDTEKAMSEDEVKKRLEGLGYL